MQEFITRMMIGAVLATAPHLCLSFSTPAPIRSIVEPVKDRDELLTGVREIVAPGGIPGDFVVFGKSAFPVLTGRSGSASLAVAAGARYGRGRAVAVGHEAFFGSAALKTEGNRAFVANIASWTSGKPISNVRVALLGQDDALAQSLRAAGAKVESVTTRDVSAELSKSDTLFLDQASLDGNANRPLIAHIRKWVENGGGIVVSGPAWGWQSVHPSLDLQKDQTGNQLLIPMGIAFAQGMLDGSRKSAYVVTPDEDLSLLGGDAALLALEGYAAKTRELTPAQLDQATATLAQIAGALPDAEADFLKRVYEICRTLAGSIIPTKEKPIRRNEPFARLYATLEAQRWRTLPANQVKAHPAAAAFPGSIPRGAERVTRTVSVDCSIPEWHGTGLYAAPGEVVTIVVPRNAVKRELSVRIGSHTDRLWSLEKWERFPDISLEKPLDSETMQVASPFGGAIFIDVPRRSNLGKISISISNAVAAPRFVRGVTTNEEWNQSLRNAPAPWAEMEGRKVILSVPSYAIRDVKDPEALMAYWDEVMDRCYELYAAPVRNRPERYCVDRQISAGYMHSGYPIMTWEDVAKTFCDLAVLRGSTGIKCWGFYHEMGHNFQQPEWTWSSFGEVTNNLFSLYGTEMLNGVKIGAHPAMTGPEMQKRIDLVNSKPGAEAYYEKDPWYPLTMLYLLRQSFGWKPFTQVFGEFRTLPGNQKPRTEREKHDEFLIRFSKACGRNIGPELRKWGIDFSDAAFVQVSSLPDWNPEPLALR